LYLSGIFFEFEWEAQENCKMDSTRESCLFAQAIEVGGFKISSLRFFFEFFASRRLELVEPLLSTVCIYGYRDTFTCFLFQTCRLRLGVEFWDPGIRKTAADCILGFIFFKVWALLVHFSDWLGFSLARLGGCLSGISGVSSTFDTCCSLDLKIE